MQRRILKHLTNYNILSNEQYGFRLGLRTDNATYKLTTEILNAVNNKLLVRGIFCDLEKAFYCVNHDILLPKMKFYGISDKDLTLYQSYLDNRYCRTAIYNDSKNSNKVSNWAIVRHGVPQGSVLGPLLFLLNINVLPRIINKTSASIIFADDTIILFAHSNLIDFNKNIHIVFTTWNEWLRANQLPLNFNKTKYVHFTTKRNMTVNPLNAKLNPICHLLALLGAHHILNVSRIMINLKTGFNNNFITNSSYTKFLGVTMDNTLSWNNHIDLLVKKLSTSC